MRFGISLWNYGPLATPATMRRLAQLAEGLGVDSIWVSDHLVAPVDAASAYPYQRGGPRPGRLGVIETFYDPMISLAWLAGATDRVRLGISAYVMPLRNPVLTAKHVATLDALSGGRLVLAVGVGWLAEEFAALDVPFAGRGARTEDYLAVSRALWRGDVAAHDGTHYRLPPVRTGPRPVQQPHPPIWIAGNSRRALDRAARIGDGWHAIDLTPEELAAQVVFLESRLAMYGRPRSAVTVSLRRNVVVSEGPATRSTPLTGDRDAIRRDLEAYRAAGLDYLVANARQGDDADALAASLERVAAVLQA